MPSGDSKCASTLEARLTAWKAENVLEPGSRPWDETRKCLLVIQSVLQLLKHSRECIIRKGINKSGINRRCTVRKDIDRSAIDRQGIDRRCIVKEGIDGRAIDRREGIDSSGINGGADDVRDNHRPQHSSVIGKLLSVSTLHIILCAFCAEDYTETTMYQDFTCHLQYSPDSGRGYVSEATK